jgi:hypothetical protein
LRLAVVGPEGSKIIEADEVGQIRDQVDGWRQAEAETLEEFVLRRPDQAMVASSLSGADTGTRTGDVGLTHADEPASPVAGPAS